MRPLQHMAVVRLVSLSVLVGCAADSVVPPSLKSQVDQTVTFAALKTSPDSFRGHLVVVGGEVLTAKRLQEGTRIEVLQLPLERGQQPVLDRMTSQGRFLALQQDFLDPATLPAGTRVTILGEVTGTTTLPLDETEYAYPTLAIKEIRVWPKPEELYPYRYGPYIGPYYGPYWGGYWHPHRHPYWW